MLQQTQVERVVPRWRAFLERFPTVAACAACPAGDVLEEWAGLGYNRRALNLWRAAGVVVERHGGAFPTTLADLLALPGVGPYTARAVLAFALEADVGVLDTNVARVLARRAGRPLGAREAQSAADAAVPVGRGWAWNQAMLDLGATTCRARAPRCGECPVARGCAWAEGGRAAPDPAIGSAGAPGGQSRFAGSDRQGRGRLVAALRAGPVAVLELAAVMGWPEDEARAARVASAVVADGLAVEAGGAFSLPGRCAGAHK
ncbi:MAG: A/G-specific adenine glycosylase [Acidimicrobiia bacterium]|nr:A/G-specific adenine glycosylase [Acidimicrobiia bacterium]